MNRILLLIFAIIGFGTITTDTYAQFYVVKDGKVLFALDNILPDSVVFERPTNYPEAVDLDLPSGNLWASFNVGATKPEEFGYHFAWGEVEPKEEYLWSTYKWGNQNAQTKYNATDNKTTLDAEDDAATVNIGSEWSTPTLNDWKELQNNCDWNRETINGINGYKVNKKGDANTYIFLPTAGNYNGDEFANDTFGFYWSATLDLDHQYPNAAYLYGFCSSPYYSPSYNSTNRYLGFSIRAIKRK